MFGGVKTTSCEGLWVIFSEKPWTFLMTFYDNYYETSVPDLPGYELVLDDSPTCHQSLKYWTDRAAEVRNWPRLRFLHQIWVLPLVWNVIFSVFDLITCCQLWSNLWLVIIMWLLVSLLRRIAKFESVVVVLNFSNWSGSYIIVWDLSCW